MITKHFLIPILFLSIGLSQLVTIKGKVIDKKNKSLEKIKISLFNEEESLEREIVTDKKGNFIFENIAAKNYVIRIKHKKKGEAVLQLQSWPQKNSDILDLKIILNKKIVFEKNITFGPEPIIKVEDEINNLISEVDSTTDNLGQIKFKEIYEELGFKFSHNKGESNSKYLFELLGSGVCLFDYDLDGDLDTYFCQGKDFSNSMNKLRLENKLFRNDQNKWTDVTSIAGVGDTTYSMGCSCGDIDNDGDIDLYVTNFGSDVLFRNNNDGTFTDITFTANIENNHWSSKSIFFDMDNDGWLDLYVVNYIDYNRNNNDWCGNQLNNTERYCDIDLYDPIPDKLYRNIGAGHFIDVSYEAGINILKAKGLGVMANDIDSDGDLDLFVANDKANNFMLINNGQGDFNNESRIRGVAVNQYGESDRSNNIDFGDINNDGYMDLLVSNNNKNPIELYINNPSGFFQNFTSMIKLNNDKKSTSSFGAKLHDINLDGLLDIILMGGSYYSSEEGQSRKIYINKGNLDFNSIPSTKNINNNSRGSAYGDLDNDGDIDIVINNNNNEPSVLMKIGMPQKNWIGLKLEGIGSNKDGIGAKVSIKTSSGSQIKDVNRAGSFLSSNDNRLLFGVGEDEKIIMLKVEWPGGSGDVFYEIDVNKYYKLIQGNKLFVISY
mgnify:CR=1 FL=1